MRRGGAVPPPPEEKAPEDAPPPPPFDAATQALIDAAQRAREELAEAERALKDTEENIRALEQELALDFGPEGEFSYLYSQCYELGTSEYIYRLCPFHRVSQKPKHGGAETNLGTWGAWAGPEHDRFAAMSTSTAPRAGRAPAAPPR
ncbi:glucosidase 2 subunit beta [Chlamydotis macqueenii]